MFYGTVCPSDKRSKLSLITVKKVYIITFYTNHHFLPMRLRKIYSPFHKTLPRSSLKMHWISVRFYEIGVSIYVEFYRLHMAFSGAPPPLLHIIFVCYSFIGYKVYSPFLTYMSINWGGGGGNTELSFYGRTL